MKHLLYCNVSTLKECTASRFEALLTVKTCSFMHVSEHLWLIDLPSIPPAGVMISVSEHFFYTLFNDNNLIREDSIALITTIENPDDYQERRYQRTTVQLPDEVHNYLSSDSD